VPTKYSVQPILKALRLLDTIGARSHDMTLAELTQESGLPKTTVFRYLQTLSEAGYLRHNQQSDRYGIGPRLALFATSSREVAQLRRSVRPEMESLAADLNLTVNLAIGMGTYIVYVDIVKPRNAPHMDAHIGQQHPMHSTAVGKAIMAHLPPAERNAALDSVLAEMTARTISSPQAMRRHLQSVKQRGYALDREETETGMSCIGCPVLDATGYPIAAISLSALDARLMSILDECSRRLIEASGCIASHLQATAIRGLSSSGTENLGKDRGDSILAVFGPV